MGFVAIVHTRPDQLQSFLTSHCILTFTVYPLVPSILQPINGIIMSQRNSNSAGYKFNLAK